MMSPKFETPAQANVKMNVIPRMHTDCKKKEEKKKLTKHIGIMVQNGVEIGRVESARCHGDRLHRPTLLGGIVNVDRSWVGNVRIENVDGVCKLNPPRRKNAERIEHTKKGMKNSYLGEVTGRVD